MKVMICTTPIRPKPTYFPPVGSLSIINHLRKNGVADVIFHHIDGVRPSYEDALRRIIDEVPDVLGISSVVSTAYAYTKRLANDVRKALPDTLIVVGGNLAASAEVLLRKTGVDLCVLGEGEIVFLNVVKRAVQTRVPSRFADIPGLMLLDEKGELVNTGYERALDKAEVYDVDWSDLEEACDISTYIYPVFDPDGRVNRPPFQTDPRTFEPHRRDKNFIVLPEGKGCVSKCTFCHRWDKGMRYIPVPVFMARLDELIAGHNVGFVEIGPENFGSDKRWLDEFFLEIKKRDILWYTGAMRTKTASPELIARMKEAGCTSITYGMETGSPRMLEVMEKKVDIQDNYNAQRWTAEAGFETVVQLVLGMPGESPETIGETIEFCKFSFTLNPDLNPNNLSINYAQALPGTPLYEYARRVGLIGADLDGEEEYLLRISDRDAHDEFTTLNFTDYPALECQSWRPRITVEVNHAFIEKFGLEQYFGVVLGGEAETGFGGAAEDDGYHANPKRLSKRRGGLARKSLPNLVARGRFGEAMILYPLFFYRLRRFLVLMVLIKNIRRFPLGYNVGLVKEWLVYKLGGSRGKKINGAYKSLRKLVWEDMPPLGADAAQMDPLRHGR